MNDSDLMAGEWIVTYGKWKYYYFFERGGGVRWQDFWNKSATGSGQWKKSGQNVEIKWSGSTTQDYWFLGDPAISAIGTVRASYGTFDDLVAGKSTTADSVSTLMSLWGQAYRDGDGIANPHCCDWAMPYTALPDAKKKQSLVFLDEGNIGRVIQKVRGLAIHTTAGNPSRTAYQTGINGCVGWWNKLRRDGTLKGVSAHFAIAVDGTLIQFVPANLVAYAQGDPADRYYLSVEIETDGTSAMNQPQLDTAKQLFTWCVNRGVPRQTATGLVGVGKKGGPYAGYDQITEDVCERGGSTTTTDPQVSAASYGLSCHVWLKPVKPCPGVGMLRQLADIVQRDVYMDRNPPLMQSTR